MRLFFMMMMMMKAEEAATRQAAAPVVDLSMKAPRVPCPGSGGYHLDDEGWVPSFLVWWELSQLAACSQ